MMSMKVDVKRSELERYIEEQVSAGFFPSAEDVVEDALLRVMVEDQTELTDEDVAAIKLSDEQFSRGEGIDADEAKKQIRRLYGKAKP
jgi:Arc/MetJ-type ribon-helix-helix transcriptional regulator